MIAQAFLQNGSSAHQLAQPFHDQRDPVPFAPVSSLSPRVAPIGFSRNTGIYREGNPVGKLYKIVSGAARTCRVLAEGRRQVAAFYLPGDFFGLEGGEKHVFSAEAITDVRLLVINRSAVASRAKWDNNFARELWTLMERELQVAQDHAGLLIKTAPERVASFLLEMANRTQSRDQVELPMSRQDIADYLGLTIEHVSRTFRQLEDASVIALPSARLVALRNRAALKRLTD
jgi:CRP-like cAMP-binding protein